MSISFLDKHKIERTMTFEEHAEYMRPHRLLWEDDIWAQRVPKDFKFKLHSTYPTLGGRLVKIIEISEKPGFRPCVKGDDFPEDPSKGWRYNDHGDIGRATGSEWDADRNLIPFEVKL